MPSDTSTLDEPQLSNARSSPDDKELVLDGALSGLNVKRRRISEFEASSDTVRLPTQLPSEGAVSSLRGSLRVPSGTAEHHLEIARDFLAIFASRCTLRGQDSLVVHDPNDDRESISLFLVLFPATRRFWIPPLDDEDAANQSNTNAGWILASVQSVDGIWTLKLWSEDDLSSSLAYPRTVNCARDTFHAVAHTDAHTGIGKEPWDTQVCTIKTYATDELAGFSSCIAVATCLIKDEKPPDTVYPWAWLSAVTALQHVPDIGAVIEPPHSHFREPAIVNGIRNTRTQSYLNDMAGSLASFKAHVIEIRARICDLRSYMEQLLLIRKCTGFSPSSRSDRNPESTVDLDQRISRWGSFLANISPTDPGRAFVEKQLEAYRQERQQADGTKVGGETNQTDTVELYGLEQWADFSLGAMSRKEYLCEQDLKRIANDLEVLLARGTDFVNRARSSLTAA